MPTVGIRTAYINKDNELVIKVNSQDELKTLRSADWTSTAFQTGISLKEKEAKLYLAILNIDPSFNVDDEDKKYEMKSQHKIINMKRNKNRKLSQPTRTIQICLNDYDACLDIANKGKIKIGYTYFKVSPWNFRKRTNQCFNCCGFNHTKKNSKSKTKCLSCTDEHSYSDCKLTEPYYKCSNCNDYHSAVSKECLVLKNHQQDFENKSQSTKPPQDFTRVYSTASNRTPPKPSFLHSD